MTPSHATPKLQTCTHRLNDASSWSPTQYSSCNFYFWKKLHWDQILYPNKFTENYLWLSKTVETVPQPAWLPVCLPGCLLLGALWNLITRINLDVWNRQLITCRAQAGRRRRPGALFSNILLLTEGECWRNEAREGRRSTTAGCCCKILRSYNILVAAATTELLGLHISAYDVHIL